MFDAERRPERHQVGDEIRGVVEVPELQPVSDGLQITADETGGETDPRGEEAVTPKAQLVNALAAEVMVHLPYKDDGVQRKTMRSLTEAIADTQGLEGAHEFVQRQVTTFDLRPSQTFELWLALSERGDAVALTEARRAAGIVTDATTGDTTQVLHGMRAAERLVMLVEAGDDESMALARQAISEVSPGEQMLFYSRTYNAGDAASLDLALALASAIAPGDSRLSIRINEALVHMANAAVANDRIEDALTIAAALTREVDRVGVHAELYSKGHAASLPIVLERLDATGSLHERLQLERSLARGGYGPAVESMSARRGVRVRADDAPRARPRHDLLATLEPTNELEDLAALHQAGATGAAQRIVEVVLAADHPDHYLSYLGRVGLTSEQALLAIQLFEEAPSLPLAEAVLEIIPYPRALETAYDYRLHEREDPVSAAELLRKFASHLQRQPAQDT